MKLVSPWYANTPPLHLTSTLDVFASHHNNPPADPFSSLIAALKQESLIPDVLPESFHPSVSLAITFPSGRDVLMGNTLAVEDTSEEPDVRIIIPDAQGSIQAQGSLHVGPGVTYTLVMTDPDAPTRDGPIYRQFRHWVITGIKPATATTQSERLPAVKTKPATTPFRPSGPRPNSGVHRYTFLLFQEPAGRDFTVPLGAKEYGNTTEERRSWNALEFGEEYALQLVGANFFLVCSSS